MADPVLVGCGQCDQVPRRFSDRGSRTLSEKDSTFLMVAYFGLNRTLAKPAFFRALSTLGQPAGTQPIRCSGP